MLRLEDIIETDQSYNASADLNLISKAYVFSAKVHKGQLRRSGEAYLTHPLEVAGILASFKLDEATISTGLLHDTVEDTYTTIECIKESFGDEIAALVDGVTKISLISFKSKEEQQAENFRKMILAMARDIRVVLVKLADRLHNMRTLEHVEHKKRIKIARETMDIYAPLAARLGIGWLKTELEDLSFLYLKPMESKAVIEKVEEKKIEREKYIKDVAEILGKKLVEHGLKGEISGRLKHYYSIYKKMEAQGIDFERIYDILAFRIILSSVRECYEVLGLIHSVWKPVAGRFKDFIAMPKSNMYQSLHTTVIGPYGERIEVQLRTEEMHRIAEEGIAAHWRYKEGSKKKEKEDKSFLWLGQLVELHKDLQDSKEFLNNVKEDLFPHDVYVFTPKGEVKEFPIGATPIDFAYSVHTEVGSRCVGAKVNGRLVPLKYKLKNGDTVEIEISPKHRPSRDWLKLVKTSRARNKIRHWIKLEENEKSIALGKEMCEKEFRRYGVNFNKLIKSSEIDKVLIESFNVTDLDSLLASVGYGELTAKQIFNKFVPSEKINVISEEGADWHQESDRKAVKKVSKKECAITVKGLDDIMVRLANCCNPLPGDDIVGFITVGRGVSVHTVDCHNLSDFLPDRKIEVAWGRKLKAVRPVRIEVVCLDEKGVLADMSSTITSAEANIASAQIKTTKDNKAKCIFEVQVDNLKHLKQVIGSLEKIKKVIKVERLMA
jgi:GTP pyrophosphokinase